MMREILESTIRAFVAEGSGIDPQDVVPGNTDAQAPDGLYSSVTYMTEMRVGQPVIFQRILSDRSYTSSVNTIEAVYSIMFYRAGAIDAAHRFSDWCMAESGLNWASTAITDGKIAGANVYNGGDGYLPGDPVVFSAGKSPAPLTPATGSIETNGRGQAIGITMLTPGQGYYERPTPIITSAFGDGLTSTARGYGFVVKSPVKVRNLTGMISGDFEERAQIDLAVCYEREFTDTKSGRVERIIGEREGGGSRSFIDIGSSQGSSTPPTTPTEDRLVYVFQTNLIPSSVDSSTTVGGAGDGIRIDRIAEWVKVGNSTNSTGFSETTLFSSNPIVPQHGRDLKSTSPFITNYEGHVAATFQNTNRNSFYIAVYYIKTTHFIPSQPNIVSVRAFKHAGLQLSTLGFAAPVPMSEFNSMVILDNDIPNGGVIGLQIDFGVGLFENYSHGTVDQVVKELNTQSSISTTPLTNVNFALNGFNSRVTFLQFDLAT